MQVPGVIQQSERQSKLIALHVIEGADRDPAHSAAFLDLEVERGEHAPFDIQPACADAREYDSADPRRAGAEAADDEALERATRFRRFSAADVRSVLLTGAGAPTPVRAGQQLTLELPEVPTRRLSAYALATLR